MPRTTEGDVTEVIDTNRNVGAFIGTANTMVNDTLQSTDLNGTTLEEIEKWLTAHLIAVADGVVEEKEIGDSSVTYAEEVGEGLKYTKYGRTALALDTTGTLANLGKRKASFEVI